MAVLILRRALLQVQELQAMECSLHNKWDTTLALIIHEGVPIRTCH
jgi:hypothetical protein